MSKFSPLGAQRHPHQPQLIGETTLSSRTAVCASKPLAQETPRRPRPMRADCVDPGVRTSWPDWTPMESTVEADENQSKDLTIRIEGKAQRRSGSPLPGLHTPSTLATLRVVAVVSPRQDWTYNAPSSGIRALGIVSSASRCTSAPCSRCSEYPTGCWWAIQ